VGFDLTERFTESVDVTNLTVKSFDGFIFLCGGAISEIDDPPLSARHYVVSRIDKQNPKLAGRSVVIAEWMTSILNDGDFHDLLEFEESIAALCSCVIIFLESPGSIAELGSFSVMRQISSKLLVFCEQRFDSTVRPSFIFLGPLANLRRGDNESVQVFPIEEEREGRFQVSKERLDDCWEDIEDAINGSLKRAVHEAKFDATSISHQMLLMASLVDIFVALTSTELEDCLIIFGVDLSGRHLRRTLKMLEQFGLIARRQYGAQHFYMSQKSEALFTFRPTAGGDVFFDVLRFKDAVIKHYEKFDPRKHKAIKNYRKEALRDE
jgi:hypothetical protein